jgi:hypothetical protein
MKFLCIPCDTAMKLQTVDPPDRGSLSIVYACPECGYEMAMLTNAYETQVVQSLGVKIQPNATSGSACPFSAMLPTPEPSDSARSAPAGAERGGWAPASDGVGGSGGAKPPGLAWTSNAEARLLNVPEFVRPMARVGIEKFALEKGAREVDDEILDAAREFFGM